MPLSFDWPFPVKPNLGYKALSTVTICLVGSVSRLWMSKRGIIDGDYERQRIWFVFVEYLTSVRIENGRNELMLIFKRDSSFFLFYKKGDILQNAVKNREPNRPMITTANHHSCKILLFSLTRSSLLIWIK